MPRKDGKKWKIIEKIVAAAFEAPDVQVQRNVRLKSIRRRGGKGGFREIDVLISGTLAGQTVHFPIECRNRSKKAGSPDIDAFIGKLLDVGLPTQTAIFVSTSGYGRPAVERAQEVGMKTLVLSDAASARTKDAIFGAIQSCVFMLCSVKQIEFKTVELTEGGSFQHVLFHDVEGRYVGALPDFLWEAWLRGAPPLVCGEHRYKFDIPELWKYLVDGRRNSIHDVLVTYQVSALVFELAGEAKDFHFLDAFTGRTERQTWQVHFPVGPMDALPKVFESEESLREFLRRPTAVRVTIGRTRLPKILMNQGMLWPMASRAIRGLTDVDPEKAEKEFIRVATSEANNFWEFDEVYAAVGRRTRSSTGVTFKVEKA